MPLHLQSITKDADKTELFTWIVQDGMDEADSLFVSEDKKFFHIQTNLTDIISGGVIGKIVYTIMVNDEQKALEILDLDIVMNNDNYCEVEFLQLLSGSSDSNEYYEIQTVADEQHLEIETVNRHTVTGGLLGTKKKLRFSAFPFQLTLYQTIQDFNEWAGFGKPIKVGDTEFKVSGYSPTFTSPAGSMAEGDEHYSFMLGTVKAYKDVKVAFGENILDFVLADVETALGQIPVAMSRDVFDLSILEVGCIIAMNADIKADISKDEDFKATSKGE